MQPIGVFHKWSEFSESDKSLSHEFGQFKDPVCYLVSLLMYVVHSIILRENVFSFLD